MLQKGIGLYTIFTEKYIKNDKCFWVILAYGYIALFSLYMMNFYVRKYENGLDISWMYALNIFNEKGIVFGRDVVFTYGPLGYLISYLNIDYNNVYAYIFNIFLIIIDINVLYYILMKTDRKNINLFFSVIFLFIAIYFGNIIIEYKVGFSVILLLLTLLKTELKIYKIFIILLIDFLIVLCFFMKFTLAIMCIFDVLCYFISEYTLSRKIKKINLLFFLIPIMFVISYYIYNPNFTEFISYCKGALEMSNGYIYAMSTPLTMRIDELLPPIVVALIMLLIICTSRKENLAYTIVIFATLFMVYKHSFVRGDHIRFFLQNIFFSLSVVMIFLPYEFITNLKIKKIMLCLGCVVCLLISSKVINNIDNQIQCTKSVIGYYLYNNDANIDNREQVLNNVFNGIKGEKISIYPWEISLINDSDEFVPLYAVQAYSCYTPYLDEKTAEIFEDDKRAPRYIVFSNETIDNRFPYIENPLTWKSILFNYYVKEVNNGRLLLERNDGKNNININSMMNDSEEKNIYDTIEIPKNSKDYFINIESSLSWWGRLVKLFYKIPEIDMIIKFDDGNEISKRILLDNLKNDTLITKIPISTSDTIKIFNNDYDKRIVSIRFDGEGLKYYSTNIKVNLKSFEENKKNEGSILNNNLDSIDYCNKLNSFKRVDDNIKFSIDIVNDTQIDLNSTIASDWIYEFKGWVYNSATNEPYDEILLKLGNKYFSSVQYDRIDVAEYFNLGGIKKCGFTSLIINHEISSEIVPISILCIDEKNKTYSEKEIYKVSNLIFRQNNDLQLFTEDSSLVKCNIDNFDDLENIYMISLNGWMYAINEDNSLDKTFSIILKNDEHIYESALLNNKRTDVADYFKRHDLIDTGFNSSKISYKNIDSGEYDVYICMKINRDLFYYKTNKTIKR